VRVERVSLAAIGRNLAGPKAAKHRIQRTWRFVANPRVGISDAMSGVIRRLGKRYRRLQRPGRSRRPKLVIALDWTQFRRFHTLLAAAVHGGRAVPLLWATYPEWVLYKSQNQLEEGLLRLLRSLIPQEVEVVLLADRGFGRTELARTCQELGFAYVIRITANVWIECAEYRGQLARYPLGRGMDRLLTKVRYRQREGVKQQVAVCWKAGLPKRRDEPWFLRTELCWKVERLVELYSKRMAVEEGFGDTKNKRNGWSLRDIRITRAERVDRLLLILALAYWLLVGVGLVARQRHAPSLWCSNNRQGECSVFSIGWLVWQRIQVCPATAFAAVVTALVQAAQKWG